MPKCRLVQTSLHSANCSLWNSIRQRRTHYIKCWLRWPYSYIISTWKTFFHKRFLCSKKGFGQETEPKTLNQEVSILCQRKYRDWPTNYALDVILELKDFVYKLTSFTNVLNFAFFNQYIKYSLCFWLDWNSFKCFFILSSF